MNDTVLPPDPLGNSIDRAATAYVILREVRPLLLWMKITRVGKPAHAKAHALLGRIDALLKVVDEKNGR